MSRLNPNPNPPPRTLNVQKFAESRSRELESLHAVISNRLNHDFKIKRNKRRRTTGYWSSNKRTRKNSVSGSDRKPSRRVRRRLEMQLNPELGFVKCRDGTRRLRTHLWHAKRFKMAKRWGFYLPLGLHGRGRGSRALLKRLKSGALVHDASYYYPIQLEGPEDSITAILRMVLLPPPSCIAEETSRSVEYGVCYKNAMLHHVVKPLSQFIAPVHYMWRPFLNENNNLSAEQDHISSGGSVSPEQECSTSSRQLWIWIHAAAFEEGFGMLRLACQEQMREGGVSVSCVSLEGRIAKLEILGSKATQIVQRILHAVPETKKGSDKYLSNCPYLSACTNSRLKKNFLLEHAEHLPSHAILSLTVNDPRDLPCKETEEDLETASQGSDLLGKYIHSSNHLNCETSANSEGDILAVWSKAEKNGAFLSDSIHLWDSAEKLNPPIPESNLCMDRHQRRLKHFYLDPTNNEISALEGKDCSGQMCPILLLKHANQGNFKTGWSIILPLSWVKAFWTSLISLGAQAIGLRERRWIACDSGLPCFPFDFPDCKAYSLLMAEEAASYNNWAELRPPAVRPPAVPIPPPWHCLESTCNKGFEIDHDIDGSDLQPCSLSSSELHDMLFRGFIHRFSSALREHIQNCTDNPSQRKLCLVRVLVRAYKEGAFEDGAIICAPILTDLQHWESRMEDEIGSQDARGKRGKIDYFQWSDNMSDELLSLLVEVKNGNRLANGNSKKYIIEQNIIPILEEALGKSIKYDRIYNKMKAWRKKLEPVESIMNNYGFGFDSTTNRLMCSDETWDNILKSHPKTPHSLRNKYFARFDDYVMVVSSPGVTGKGASRLGADGVDDTRFDNMYLLMILLWRAHLL